MHRRLFSIFMATALVAGLAVAMPTAGAQEIPETNLDLTIDPDQGPSGTEIATSVPSDQALAECLDPDLALDDLVAALEDVIAEAEGDIGDLEDLIDLLPPLDPEILELEAIIAQLQGVVDLLNGVIAALPGIGGIALFYVIAFADIVTQEPIGPTGNWDPLTGQGAITVPDVPEGVYAVAALCLGVDPTIDLEEVVAALQGVDPENPEALVEAVLMLFINQEEPLGLGFQLYCLGDEVFCSVPFEDLIPGGPGGPAQPVSSTPRLTG